MNNQYTSKQKISICIPIKNESSNIKNMLDEINSIFQNYLSEYYFEVIFTDNNSTDHSFEIIKNLAKTNKNIKAFQFSKDIGKERSLFYALKKSSGDAVIQIDCDFEDPPFLIVDFVNKWKEGFDIVYGVRKKRLNDKYFFLRSIFYKFIGLLSQDHLPNNAGDFRLCDKKVIQAISVIDDHDPYIRGLISSIGFKQIGVMHDRGKRITNKSKFNLFTYINNALNGITNHSILPLKLATYLGFIIFFLCIVLTIFYFIHSLLFEKKVPGFTTQTLLILFSIAFNSIFLGIIGEYVGRLYRQVKKNDIFIIKDKIND